MLQFKSSASTQPPFSLRPARATSEHYLPRSVSVWSILPLPGLRCGPSTPLDDEDWSFSLFPTCFGPCLPQVCRSIYRQVPTLALEPLRYSSTYSTPSTLPVLDLSHSPTQPKCFRSLIGRWEWRGRSPPTTFGPPSSRLLFHACCRP